MSTMQIDPRAEQILKMIKFLTIASVGENGEPWNTPVFFANDFHYNLYWASDQYSTHSKNIKQNSNIFIVIYDSTVPETMGVGLYIQARAVEIDNPIEIKKAHDLLAHRGTDFPWMLKEFFTSTRPKLFKATPTKMWISGEGKIAGTYKAIRQELKLH